MKKSILTFSVAILAFRLFAAMEMGAPFSDGAVLQRGMKVPVWGKVTPFAGGEEKILVEFAGQKKTAAIGTDGRWKVELDPMEASKEGRTLTVSRIAPGQPAGAKTESTQIKDVLVGEVWFASGQSNMECHIWNGRTRYRDMKGALVTAMTCLPCVRYLKSARAWSVTPLGKSAAKWCSFTPKYLQPPFRSASGKPGSVQLSAVAFYYARELYLALDVPVGIIDASWGGTNIDAWTPRSGYSQCDESIRATAEYPVKADWKPEYHQGPIGRAHQQPTVLYNGMVAPFAPMAMRGVIWYQGCHNQHESGLYRAKLHALYNGWSRDFANPDLSFYLVQLAPWKHNWVGICMAQNEFVAEQKNAALAVTSDVGNFDDIHPNDKEIVAKRLVVHALKRDYGFPIREADSPVFVSARRENGTAAVTFDNVKEWYVYAPDHSRSPAFELAGDDGVWHEAKVVNYRKTRDKKGTERETDFIDGPVIVLASESVSSPAKVRYMGKPRTSGTLYNEMSLPLGPFEADLVKGEGTPKTKE